MCLYQPLVWYTAGTKLLFIEWQNKETHPSISGTANVWIQSAFSGESSFILGLLILTAVAV
jgi:hypothetical protein